MKINLGPKELEATIVSENLWKLIKPPTHPGTPNLYAVPIGDGENFYLPIDEHDVAEIHRPEKIEDFVESLSSVCTKKERDALKKKLKEAEGFVPLENFFPKKIRS